MASVSYASQTDPEVCKYPPRRGVFARVFLRLMQEKKIRINARCAVCQSPHAPYIFRDPPGRIDGKMVAYCPRHEREERSIRRLEDLYGI